MDRNLHKRIEICVTVLDERIKRRMITNGLKPYLNDNTRAWEMQSDGSYRRRRHRGNRKYSVQAGLLVLGVYGSGPGASLGPPGRGLALVHPLASGHCATPAFFAL